MRAETIKANFANLDMVVFRGSNKGLLACVNPAQRCSDEQAVQMVKAIWKRAVGAVTKVETVGSVTSLSITPVFA